MPFYMRKLMQWSHGRSFDLSQASSVFSAPTSYVGWTPTKASKFSERVKTDASGNVTLQGFVKVSGNDGIILRDGTRWDDVPEPNPAEYVQSAYSTQSASVSFSQALQAGDLVVACVSDWAYYIAAASGMTQAAFARHYWYNTTYYCTMMILYRVASGGETSMQIASLSGATDARIAASVFRFGGAPTVTVRNAQTHQATGGGSFTLSGASYGAPQILVAGRGRYTGSADASMTGTPDFSRNTANSQDLAAAFKLQTSPANQTFSWGASGVTQAVAACVLEVT